MQIILNLLQVGKKPEKITYVGIHNRRTDYLEFRRKRLKLDNLYEDYFEDAMEYFREEYWDTTVVFVYVSDDMKWGRRNLKDSKNLFFLGNLQQKITEFCTLQVKYHMIFEVVNEETPVGIVTKCTQFASIVHL